jgi:hypothetical protein
MIFAKGAYVRAHDKGKDFREPFSTSMPGDLGSSYHSSNCPGQPGFLTEYCQYTKGMPGRACMCDRRGRSRDRESKSKFIFPWSLMGNVTRQ